MTYEDALRSANEAKDLGDQELELAYLEKAHQLKISTGINEPSQRPAPILPQAMAQTGRELGLGALGLVRRQGIGLAQLLDALPHHQDADTKAYTARINAEGERLNALKESQTTTEGIGEDLGKAAEFMAVPVPAKIGARIPLNMATGASFSALNPTADNGSRAEDALIAGTMNAAIPEIGGGALAAVLGMGRYARRVASPKHGAAHELELNFGPGYGKDLWRVPPGGGGGGSIPQDGMGPIRKPFQNSGDVQPTLAELMAGEGVPADERIMVLQRNAQLRHEGFWQRQQQNKLATFDNINQHALNDAEITALKDKANAVSGPLREKAFKAARASSPIIDPKSLPEYLLPLQQKVQDLRKNVNTRAAPDVQTVAGLAEDYLKPKGEPAYDPADVYNLRKMLNKQLSGPLKPLDANNAAIKAASAQAMGLRAAADEGLNTASGGAFEEYLATHAALSKEPDSGQSMRNVVDRFGKKATIHGTEIPDMTAHALRSADKDLTWNRYGRKGLVDLLLPEARQSLGGSIQYLNAQEAARAGAIAVSGSSTAPNMVSLLRSGVIPGTGTLASAINLMDSLGMSKRLHELDDAILNPEKWNSLMDLYAKTGAPSTPQSKAFKRAIKAAAQAGANDLKR